MELSEEGVPHWRCCFDEQCEARFESFEARATHVLRHHRQMEMVSQSVITNQCPVCLAVYGDRKRLIVVSCHRFVVDLVVIDHVISVKCTFHCFSVVQFAQPNLEIGQSSNSISLNICA